MAQMVVLTILYTWIWNNTGGSVLAATMFHAVGNIAAAAIPYWVVASGRWINFGLLLVAAAIAVWVWGPGKMRRA